MISLREEKLLFRQGYKAIAGIDEAGRGPLAGPVVAACVIIKHNFKFNKKLNLIKDSKKLNPKNREELFKIINKSFETGVGVCDHNTIDRINILQASFLAMKKAISALKDKPEFILLDGKFAIPNTSYKQKPIIKGDETVFSIAAASIVAKVVRDQIMKDMHKKYSQYGFDKHKGYGTKFHIEQIKKHGLSEIHRKSFKPCQIK